jgi:hypothetical protein
VTFALVGAGIVVASIPFSQAARAAETRGYVVSWFVPAMNSIDGYKDCPDGVNPDQAQLLTSILRDKGLPEKEVASLTAPEAVQRNFNRLAPFRGKIGTETVDVYLHPLSKRETIKLLDYPYGLGFNLDGRDGKGNFTDPLTGEKGVDNELSRVFGCFDRTRGTPDVMPGNAVTIWRGGHLGMSWLIEVRGADNLQNDDDVEVSIYRGLQPTTANSSGDVQRNMTYTVDTDPRMQNTFRGRIKDGLFVSNPDATIDFFMVADMRVQGYYDFKRTRLRLEFRPDGSVRGYVGGYLPIKLVYSRHTQARAEGEYNNGFSFPAVYQAMLALADTDIDKDAATGMRTRISATYQIRGVPAFLRHVSPPLQIQTRSAALMPGR